MLKVIKTYYEQLPCQIILLTWQHFSSYTTTKKSLNRKKNEQQSHYLENLCYNFITILEALDTKFQTTVYLEVFLTIGA